MLSFSFLASEPIPFPPVSLLSLFGHRCLSCRHMNIRNKTCSRVLLYSFLSVGEKPFYIGTQRHGRLEKVQLVNVIRRSICAVDVLCRYSQSIVLPLRIKLQGCLGCKDSLFPDHFWQIHYPLFWHMQLKQPETSRCLATDGICSGDRTCPGQCHREALNIHTRPSCHQIR